MQATSPEAPPTGLPAVEPEPPTPDARAADPRPRFAAFLSYATDPDAACARDLERFLEAFHRVPSRDLKLAPLRVCRDGSDFRVPKTANSGLPSVIEDCLARSDRLIVLCSPGTLRSTYIHDEIAWWLAHRSPDSILLAVTAGRHPARDPAESFHPLLVDAGLHRRLWFDLRAWRGGIPPGAEQVRDFDDARVALASELYDLTAGDLQPLWQRELRVQARRRRVAAVVLGIAVVVAIIFGLVAIDRSYKAQHQARVAQKRQAEAYLAQAEILLEQDRPAAAVPFLVTARALGAYGPRAQTLFDAAAISIPTLLVACRDECASSGELAWSADETTLAHVEGKSAIRWPIAGGVTSSFELPFDPEGWVWQRDGGALVIWRDGEVPRIVGADGNERVRLVMTKLEVDAAAWNADGTRVMISSWPNVRVFDATTGAGLEPVLSLGTLPSPSPRSTELAWSPDGASLAVLADDRLYRLALTGTSGPTSETPGVRAIAWSGDDRLAYATAEQIHIDNVGLRPVPRTTLMAWRQDAEWLATGGDTDLVRIWTTDQQDALTEIHHRGDITAVAWSRDGQRLASASNDGIVRISLDDAEIVLEHGLQVQALSWSPTGRYLATMAAGVLRVWDTRSASARTPWMYHNTAVQSVGWDADGTRLYSVGGAALVWNAKDGSRLREIPTFSGADREVAIWSHDGQLLVGWSVSEPASPPRSIVEVRPPSSRGVEGRRFEIDGHINAAAWSRDGQQVAIATASGVTGLNLTAGSRWTAEVLDATTVAWSPDGARLAIAGPHRLQVVAASDGNVITEVIPLAGAASSPPSITWTEDSARLAAPSMKSVVIVDFERQTQVVYSTQHQGRILSLAWSPDGSRLATGGADGTARMWRVPALSAAARRAIGSASPLIAVGPSLGHQASLVLAVAWSPDGIRLATAGDDQTARVWDAKTGEPAAMPLRHVDAVSCLAWSPDGRRLATGGDRRVRVWQLEPTTSTMAEWRAALDRSPYALDPAGRLVTRLPAALTGAAP